MSTYPTYDPETEDLVYRVLPSHQAESISDITSEAESAASAVTIWSDDVDDYFTLHQGRQHPACENAVRWLPSDNTKWDILRHVADKYLAGGDYMGPVKEMLRSATGVGRQFHVLEIGTRTGVCIQEIAAEFPRVQFRSLDVVPIAPHIPRPNIVFEVYDIAEGLLLDDESQDIVFINFGLFLIKDYQALLREIHRVLRPGGLIYLRESSPYLWDSKDHTKLAQTTNPIGCHLVDLVCGAMMKSGVDLDACNKLDQWLSPESDLWSHASRSRGFGQIRVSTRLSRAYPHDGYPCAVSLAPHMASLMGHLFIMSVRETVGLLVDSELSAEEAASLAEAMIDELKDPKGCASVKLFTACGIKVSHNAP